jgi:hypothetical protein
MPAINLTKLRYQVQELMRQTSNPELFIKNLEDLFEFYKNYSLRVDKRYIGINLPKYNTPKQVIATIENELGKLLSTNPDLGLELATLLWDEPYLETKLLAVSLMSSIPSHQAIQVLSRIPEISKDIHEQDVFIPILTTAFIQIRKENPTDFINMISSWLSNPDSISQHWGLLIITNLIQKPDDKDLPSLFELLKPLLWSNDPTTQADLVQCIESLYTVSPSETEYFLVDSLNTTNDEILLKNFSRTSRELPDNLFVVVKPLIKSRLISIQTKK